MNCPDCGTEMYQHTGPPIGGRSNEFVCTKCGRRVPGVLRAGEGLASPVDPPQTIFGQGWAQMDPGQNSASVDVVVNPLGRMVELFKCGESPAAFVAAERAAGHDCFELKGNPSLLVVSQRPLSRQSREHIRAQLENLDCTGKPIIFEHFRVYQLLDGRWQSLPGSDVASEQSPVEAAVVSVDPHTRAASDEVLVLVKVCWRDFERMNDQGRFQMVGRFTRVSLSGPEVGSEAWCAERGMTFCEPKD